jgi:hypothetical protein
VSDDPTNPESDAPANTPAPAPTIDVEAIKSELTAAFTTTLNERIAGVQSGFQKQLNEKDAEIRRLRLGSMSDSERAKAEDDEAEAYVAELERKATILEITRKFPKVADAFEKLMGAESPEKQAELLLSFIEPAAPAPTPEQEAEDEVPDVLPNNPAPKGGTQTGDRLPDGTPVTEESAMAFLKALGDTPIGGYR